MPFQCKLFFFNCVGIQTVLNTLPQIDSKTVFYVHCTITLAIDLEFYHHNLFPVPDYKKSSPYKHCFTRCNNTSRPNRPGVFGGEVSPEKGIYGSVIFF